MPDTMSEPEVTPVTKTEPKAALVAKPGPETTEPDFLPGIQHWLCPDSQSGFLCGLLAWITVFCTLSGIWPDFHCGLLTGLL